ncbi:MAG TPA: cytoplasmic chaperone TorD family protein [Chlorobaculum parvum]|uniref:Cytoplasmic chaperone TorD family protein n=1 Tax=Chlorobaculum parvum TaxID=274539 RepID=A0A7C5HI37_9CHLB|nr:cytoplasmic chaperone TorD family protein [Chlorobaculum parvum]
MNSPLQKSLLFKFLSKCLAYPNEAFLPALVEVSDEIEAGKDERQALIRAFELEEQEPLQAEYTRLFINGYPHTVCPPYEAIYCEKRMHGESTVAVSAAYQEWEMTVDPGLIDHLSTELEFLAFLASAESLENAVATDARKAAERFTREHLCRWLPQFIEELKGGAKMECYRKLGELMERELGGYCGER